MCERIQNWETVSQNWEKRVHWPARSFTLDDFRTTRADRVRSSPLSCQSRFILRACRVGRVERRCRPNPTSVLRSRLTLLEREFRRARRIQFWFQSVVPVAIRPAQRVGPSLTSARFARLAASFTLVRTRAWFSSQCFAKDNVGPSAFMDVSPSLFGAIRRDVIARRSRLHVTRVNATLDGTRDTRDHRRGRRDGQRGGDRECQRRGLRLRIG